MPYARYGGRVVSSLGKRPLAGSATRRLVRRRIASSSARRFALGPYAGTAFALGSMGLKYAVGRRRRAVYRAKRNYNRSKAKIGKSPYAKRPCKCRQVASAQESTKALGTIHIAELDTIAKETSLPSEQQRYSDYVHIKGWRVHKWFKNEASIPMMFHVAIITTKIHESSADLSDATGKANVLEDLLRDETDTNRVVTPGIGTNGMVWNHYRLNTDRWIVLKRYRRLLEANTTNDKRRNQWNLNRYVKFNRQLHFDNTEDKPESNRTILIHWAAAPNATSSTLPTSAGYKHASDIKCFFRDLNPK